MPTNPANRKMPAKPRPTKPRLVCPACGDQTATKKAVLRHMEKKHDFPPIYAGVCLASGLVPVP